MTITEEYLLASVATYNELRVIIRESGLTLTQWALLARLNEVGKQRKTDLARYLHVEVAAAVMTCRYLLKQELIAYTTPSSDRREKYVTIMPAGKRAFSRLAQMKLEEVS
jgi:DNA-binding MarR family transcriptional regulator